MPRALSCANARFPASWVWGCKAARRAGCTDLDRADMCIATGNALSRHTGYDANLTKVILGVLRDRVQGVR